jgi:hypothetical protein
VPAADPAEVVTEAAAKGLPANANQKDSRLENVAFIPERGPPFRFK